MAATTINQLSRMIIDKLAYRYSDLLNSEVKADIKSWLSKLIRQDIERNGMRNQYNHTFVVPLVKVDYADNCLIDVDCSILKTDRKIPAPIAVKGDVQFKFVGTVDKRLVFTYTEKELLPYVTANKYTGFTSRYFYENNYIYVLSSTLKEKFIAIEAIFYDSEILQAVCSDYCVTDEDVVAIPDDLLVVIEAEVIKTFLIKPVENFIV